MKKLGLVSMGRIGANSRNLGPGFHSFTVDLDSVSAFKQFPAQGAANLISNEQQMALGSGKLNFR